MRLEKERQISVPGSCVRVMRKKANSAAASLGGVDAADRNSGRSDDQGPCSRLKNDS